MGRMALVTMAFSPEYKKIGDELTFYPMKEYCYRYGLDFINIDHCRREHSAMQHWKAAAWERLIWMYDILGEYDRVIHAEVDVIVAKDARDILSILPPGTFYGFDEAAPDLDVPPVCESFLVHAEEDQEEKRAAPQTIMYNSGVFVCDKEHREVFRPAMNEDAYCMAEMGLMNLRITGFKHKDVSPDVINLSHEWENGHRPGKPDLLHVMWKKEPTMHEEVQRFMGRMGW